MGVLEKVYKLEIAKKVKETYEIMVKMADDFPPMVIDVQFNPIMHLILEVALASLV